jgi:hypothetical protein
MVTTKCLLLDQPLDSFRTYFFNILLSLLLQLDLLLGHTSTLTPSELVPLLSNLISSFHLHLGLGSISFP